MKETYVFLLCVMALSGCGDGSMQDAATSTGRHYEKHVLARGERIFQTHCAVCHGHNGESRPNWQVRGSDGMLPPPPLDDNGRAWQRTRPWLKQKIHDGSAPGQGNMPPWGNKLTAEEIDDVVTWVTSLWSDAVYLQWQQVERAGLPPLQERLK